MGLTIHYSGRFNPSASLEEMINEVTDIVSVYQWPVFVFERAFGLEVDSKGQENLFGLCFTPPGCETVWLCFLADYRMSGPAQLQFWGKRSGDYREDYLYALSTKTQYAGMQVHILIVKLLKYVEKKYLLDFQVYDEGEYWETGDEKIFEANFKRYTAIIDQVAHAFETFTLNHNETMDDYFERVMKWVQENRNSETSG